MQHLFILDKIKIQVESMYVDGTEGAARWLSRQLQNDTEQARRREAPDPHWTAVKVTVCHLPGRLWRRSRQRAAGRREEEIESTGAAAGKWRGGTPDSRKKRRGDKEYRCSSRKTRIKQRAGGKRKEEIKCKGEEAGKWRGGRPDSRKGKKGYKVLEEMQEDEEEEHQTECNRKKGKKR